MVNVFIDSLLCVN